MDNKMILPNRQILERFTAWAEITPGIRAALLIGSQARETKPADPWSDIDILVYADNPGYFLTQTAWLGDIVPVWTVIPWGEGKGEPVLRVLFEGARFADFFIYSTTHLKQMVKEGLFPRSVHRGARVILDKDDLAEKIIPPAFSPLPLRPPSPREFKESVEHFWYLALYILKKWAKGRLWLVKVWDAKLKEEMLKMLQWHVRTCRGWDTDTWYFGHYLEEWADKDIVKKLEDAFGRYNKEDSGRALAVSIEIFRRIARETADNLDYPYPQAMDNHVSRWIERHLEGI